MCPTTHFGRKQSSVGLVSAQETSCGKVREQCHEQQRCSEEKRKSGNRKESEMKVAADSVMTINEGRLGKKAGELNKDARRGRKGKQEGRQKPSGSVDQSRTSCSVLGSSSYLINAAT